MKKNKSWTSRIYNHLSRKNRINNNVERYYYSKQFIRK